MLKNLKQKKYDNDSKKQIKTEIHPLEPFFPQGARLLMMGSFRNSMLLAFTLLTTGYGGLALFPTWLESAGLVEYGHTTVFKGLTESGLQYGIIPIMALIVIGGAFIKSVISGTVAA